MKVDNAVIMAAGMSSRFTPLSYETPKALLTIRGEVLIERQIRQLHEAGISEIIVVVGYKKELFTYLEKQFAVTLVENPSYQVRNNHSSIYAVRQFLKNTYICSADNYFINNPFQSEEDESYYAAVYADGTTNEWCIETDPAGYITNVTIGGSNAWYMLGHTFWSETFSRTFCEILEREYNLPETVDKLWEKLFIAHLDQLKMKIRHYACEEIYEFDTLDELRQFDASYQFDTRSPILKKITKQLGGKEEELTDFIALKTAENNTYGFSFCFQKTQYCYDYATAELRKCTHHEKE